MDTSDVLIPAGIVVLVAVVIAAAIHDSNEWDKFKIDHHCKVVGKMDGDVFNTFGVGSNGQAVVGIGTTPGKTGWLCDDGVTYWK